MALTSSFGTGNGAAAMVNLLFPTVFDAITAYAGGGQTNAVVVTAQMNNVTTVGSGNDSVKLPPFTYTPDQLGSIGVPIFIKNSAAANSMQVYGSGTDTINGVATATGVAVPAGKMAMFVLTSISSGVGAWQMMLGA